MRRCNRCLKEIPYEGARFCPFCGGQARAVGNFCHSCGYEMRSDFRFCPSCGAYAVGEKKDHPVKRGIKEDGESLFIQHWLEYSEDNIFEDYIVRRHDTFSYCIREERANDLRINKRFILEPDAVYYISVDIRTENVVNRENKENPVGACISTNDWYFSRSLFATNDWQTVGVLGRSDECGRLTVSFNLGYTFNTCSGTAWFENVRFTPASSFYSGDNRWRILAVILTETGINTIDDETGERISLLHKMSHEERVLIRQSLAMFERDFNIDAEGRFSISLEIVEPDVRCNHYTKTSLGYTISGPSACEYLEGLGVDALDYDHVIFIACQPDIPAGYFGLGGLPIKGQVGYSFILHKDLPESMKYLRGQRDNSWVPTIYAHEFLHSIERQANALRLPVPLVDGDRHGYPDIEEYRAWYRDFMHKRILVDGEYLGVDARVWWLRPSLFGY